MTDTPQLLLAHHLKSLRLPTFLREYDKVAKQCAAEGIDHSRYLLRLAELELIDRERRMVERRIKAKFPAAKFPAVKSLAMRTSSPWETAAPADAYWPRPWVDCQGLAVGPVLFRFDLTPPPIF